MAKIYYFVIFIVFILSPKEVINLIMKILVKAKKKERIFEFVYPINVYKVQIKFLNNECIYFKFNLSIFRIILIWRHANSCKVAQSRVKSVYFRRSWAVMATPVKSIYFRPFCQNFPPSHAQSCQVRGIPRTKGGLHSHEQLCRIT